MSYRQESVNREPPAACSDRIGAVPCSQPRAAPRILSSACARQPVHVQNALPLSPCPVPAISARFPRPHDAPRLPTSFPPLSPRLSPLRQCSARRRRDSRVEHWLSSNVITRLVSTGLLRWSDM